MALPKGWSAAKGHEEVTITGNVGGPTQWYEETISSYHGGDEDYPSIDSYTTYQYGRNLGIKLHESPRGPQVKAVRIYQRSTDESEEGKQNYMDVTIHGKDSDGKAERWKFRVNSDICY